jgi:hypothetical protein
VCGNFDDAFLFQNHVFGKHAVDAAAERGALHMRTRLAASPALEKTAGDLVAVFYAGDAGADFNHFAGAVGKRNDVVADRRAIAAAHNAEVAKIE